MSRVTLEGAGAHTLKVSAITSNQLIRVGFELRGQDERTAANPPPIRESPMRLQASTQPNERPFYPINMPPFTFKTCPVM